MTTTQQPTTATAQTIASGPSPVRLDPRQLVRAISKRSFATVATTSPVGQPHVAGVLYAMDGTDLWFNTMANSRKARNIAANHRVAVTIPIRRLPVGPPSTIQFQATAERFTADSPEVVELAAAGRLKSITGHGELELDGACFIRVRPNRRLHTYGLGLSLWKLIRDPLNAGGSISLDELR